jgi:hypothetical protein
MSESKCQCRIWKNGSGNDQCSRNKKVGDFCNQHINIIIEEGTWWLGLITGPRPEEPFGPPGVKTRPKGVHLWNDQKDLKGKNIEFTNDGENYILS